MEKYCQNRCISVYGNRMDELPRASRLSFHEWSSTEICQFQKECVFRMEVSEY